MADCPACFPAFRHRSAVLPRLAAALAGAGISLSASAQQAPEAVPGLSGSNFVQGLLGLAAVIAVLLLAAWLAKRFGGATPWGQGGALKVLGGLSVGPRERIVLIEVGDTWLVVGVTATQIRTLHRLPRCALDPEAVAAAQPPFARWLKDMIERRNHAE